MAEIKISELPVAAALTGVEKLPAVQAGGTVGPTVDQISTYTKIDLAESTGASLIGFIQNFNGSVPRTLQDISREAISIKDFGAVVDGIADDHSAVCKAFNLWRGAITNNGATATFTCEANHNFTVGQEIEIFGSTEETYSGIKTVLTTPTSSSWTFAITGSPINDGNSQVRCYDPNLGYRTISIPAGITCISKRVQVGPRTTVLCNGEIKFTGGNDQGHVVQIGNVEDVVWIGGIINANLAGNANCLAIGGASAVVPFGGARIAKRIRVLFPTLINTVVATATETANGNLFSGGGKGLTVQFACEDVVVISPLINECDIGLSVEGVTSNTREVNGVVITSPVIRNAHRCPMFFGGSNAAGISSDASANSDQPQYPGCTIQNPRVIGGNDVDVAVPGDATYPNYQVCGVITGKITNGIVIEGLEVRNPNRITLVRGHFMNTRIQGRVFTDEIEDVLNWNPVPLEVTTAVMANNDLDLWLQNELTTQHYGWFFNGEASRFRNSRLRFAFRGLAGTKLIKDSASIGTAVEYDFTDLETSARLIGDTTYLEVPTGMPVAGQMAIRKPFMMPTLRNGANAEVASVGELTADGLSLAGLSYNDRPLILGGRKFWLNGAVLRHATTPTAATSGSGLANMLTRTAADGDTTPTVSVANVLLLSNTSATTVTTLDDGIDGQEVALVFTNGNTTLDYNSTLMRLNPAVDVTPAANSIITMQNVQGVWREKSRTINDTQSIVIACGSETDALTVGTGKVTFRMPYALTLTGVRASLTTAQASGSIFTVDINEGGTSILSTKLTIDNTEKTSVTAAQPVISDATLADDAEITIDIDQVGDGTAIGLKVYLIGRLT